MTKNPFINAALAAIYIVVIVNIINYTRVIQPPETILIPIVMLSLLTLSVAVMGYLFISQPIQLYLDGEKKQAVAFFLKTLAAFAVITILFALALLLRIFF